MCTVVIAITSYGPTHHAVAFEKNMQPLLKQGERITEIITEIDTSDEYYEDAKCRNEFIFAQRKAQRITGVVPLEIITCKTAVSASETAQ